VKEYLKKGYAAYIAIRIASFIVSSLPVNLALRIGKFLGLCMYHFHPKRKRIAYANLKAAFCKDKTPSELKDILIRTYKNYGQTTIEMLMMPRIDRAYLKKYAYMENRYRISEAQAKGKGAIYLTSHFGNWELSSLKSAEEGFPLYVLVRQQKMEMLNNLLNSYREKLGCKTINRGMPLREIIKGLKDNGILGILADQDVGKSGVFIDLCGRPASTPVGGVRFARDTGATIVPCFMIRKEGPRHVLTLEESFTIPKTNDRDGDIRKGLERHNRILESYITQYPDQWMWVYTRWKSTPLRKVVILNDGKQGHLNQSKAVIKVIKRCRRDAGYKDTDTSVEIVDIKFKNRFRRSLLSICAVFASHSSQGCMEHLKFSLQEDSYNAIVRAYADIVISCGSSLSAVNVFLSKECNSKNVIIMKPGIAGLRNFNVAIIPKHDRPKERHNTVITQGSPNLVDKDTMKDGAREVQKLSNLTLSKRLGVFIGGDNPEYSLTTGLAEELIGQIKRSIEELDMELLITTSRRTPKDIEDLLKRRFGSNPRCKLLIIANEKNVENTVSGILELSEIVLVSGESISMVSEAASSGKRVIVFGLEKKRSSSFDKHDYAIKDLVSSNYIVETPVSGIHDTIVDLSRRKDPVRKLDDVEKMYEKLYRII